MQVLFTREGINRRDIDDMAAAWRAPHCRHQCSEAVEHSDHIDCKDPLEIAKRHLVQRRPDVAHTCVVDTQGYRTEACR